MTKATISNARGSSIQLFSSVARENYERMTYLEAQIVALQEKQIEPVGEIEAALIEQNIAPVQKDLAKASIIAIVFATLAVEAYIYDYAARRLGDAFVKDYIDKLDLLSKWVVVPKLITSHELPRREHWFALLRQLIKARNSIVHHKSSDPASFAGPDQYFKKQEADANFLYETARQSAQLLDQLADKITELDPHESAWVHTYLK